MTEKRYGLIYEKEPRGQVVTDNGIPCTAKTCCTRLNRLEEENEQLKLDKQHLHQAMSREEVRHKQFRDKVFDLIDKSLEKDKQYYEMSYEDYLNGRIEALEELKKELTE